jgi:serine/threonine protein phosphatase PrpC
VGGSGPVDEPALEAFDLPPGAGYLLLCTDGLWNCVPEPERLAGLLAHPEPASDALAAAQRLVDHACDRCGHDNITAALLAFPSSTAGVR